MKLLHLSLPFQHAEAVEEILWSHGVENYAVHRRVAGRDAGGRHDGSQAFPGHLAVFQAQVPDGKTGDLLEDLSRFRDERKSRRHLQALVLPVEQDLTDGEPERGGREEGSGP